MIKRPPATIALLISIFFVFYSPAALAGKNNQALVFHGHSLSADFDNKTLKEVLGYFKKEKGVWVKGDEILLKEKVSFHFQNLTIEDGLKRILNQFNYGIFYSKEGNPLGIYLVGKGKKSNFKLESNSRGENIVNNQNSKKSFFPEDLGEKVEVVVNSPPPGGLDKANTDIQSQSNLPGGSTPEEADVSDTQKTMTFVGSDPAHLTSEQSNPSNIQKHMRSPMNIMEGLPTETPKIHDMPIIRKQSVRLKTMTGWHPKRYD